MSTNAFRQISSVLVVMVVCAAVPQFAAAQTAAQKTAAADAKFTEGQNLMAASRFAEACEAFERSQAIEASIGTLMNIANCREKNGQLATASRLFADGAEQLRSGTDPDSVALRKVCNDRVASLKPRLSRLTVRVAADQPDGFELRRGDAVTPSAQWGQAVPVDGGTYQLTATAPGHQPWSESITVKNEGDSVEAEVPVLTAVAAEAPAKIDVTARSTTPEKPSQIVPISLGVGALVLGGVAIGLDVNARGIYDDSVATMDRANDVGGDPILEKESEDLWKKAKTRRYVAQGVAVAAAGCAGVAVYLYIRNRGKESSATARTLTPLLGPGAEGGGVAGLQLTGGW
jgi:hypothetical protein